MGMACDNRWRIDKPIECCGGEVLVSEKEYLSDRLRRTITQVVEARGILEGDAACKMTAASLVSAEPEPKFCRIDGLRMVVEVQGKGAKCGDGTPSLVCIIEFIQLDVTLNLHRNEWLDDRIAGVHGLERDVALIVDPRRKRFDFSCFETLGECLGDRISRTFCCLKSGRTIVRNSGYNRRFENRRSLDELLLALMLLPINSSPFLYTCQYLNIGSSSPTLTRSSCLSRFTFSFVNLAPDGAT
jgi:hypothetical protein